MTVSSSTSRISYAGNGSETIFAFPYYFLAASDLVVVRRDEATGAETTLTLESDYAVTGAGEAAGGTVTTAAPPAAGETLTIRRVVGLAQETDFVANDPLDAEVLERTIDRAAMADQQLQEQADRAIKLPVGDSTALSTTLPPAALRASRSLGFNAAGEPIAVDPPLVSSTDLVVVANTAPPHETGRLWVDTGTAGQLIIRQSDGADWVELWRVDAGAHRFLHHSDVVVASADGGAAAGPAVILDRASASPSAGDQLGAADFQGRSDAGTARRYARLLAEIADAADMSEGGRLLFQTAAGGALATRLALGDRLLLAAALETAKGASVASAATTDIWNAGDGTLLHVTGTTTITSFGTAPQAGALRIVLFDAAVTLTHGANLVLNAGGANITTAAGDMAIVVADTVTKHHCYLLKASGSPFARSFTSEEQTITSGGSLTIAHSFGAVPKLIVCKLVCKTADIGFAVDDEVFVNPGMADGTGGSTNGVGVTVVADSTSLNIRFGNQSSAFNLIRKDTGALTSITNSSWRFLVSAYA